MSAPTPPTEPAALLGYAFEEGFYGSDKETALACLADTVELLQTAFQDTMSAEECWESHMVEMEAFPDQDAEFLGTWQDGDMAFARVRITGTFENEITFSGTRLEPTGETFETTGVYLARVEDGQITGLATYTERWKILQQLGVLDLG